MNAHVTYIELRNLLGKSTKSREWKRFVKLVGESPQLSKMTSTWGFYTLCETGISFEYDKPGHQITGVFFYATGKKNFERYDEYSVYRGELPAGVLITDTKQDVLQKL